MKKILLSVLAISLLACNEEPDDKVRTVDKNGSVETKIHVNHLTDSLDVMKTENIFWVKNQEVKRVVRLDTIPSLGYIQEKGENSAGEDTTVTVRKNYQIFITVN